MNGRVIPASGIVGDDDGAFLVPLRFPVIGENRPFLGNGDMAFGVIDGDGKYQEVKRIKSTYSSDNGGDQ